MTAVRHAAVYHNPERMGFSVAGDRRGYFLTDKRVGRGAVGSRVWLLTGEGRPRRYYLRGTLTVAGVEPADEDGFRWRVWGEDARYFVPMLDVTDAEWFEPFRRSQGSFAFGWQTIAEERFVRALEAAAAGAAWAPADRAEPEA
jgi:hypothetical protein